MNVAGGRRYPLRFVFVVYTLPVIGGVLLGPFVALTLDIAVGRPVESFHGFIALVVAGVVLTVAARVLLVAKRQGNVEVVVDDAGIRELDDGVVRVDIPWDQARASVEHRKLRYRESVFKLVTVRFAAPSGEQIVLTNGDEGGLFPRLRFRSYARQDLTLEIQRAERLPPIPDGAVDPRDKEEHGTGVGRFFRRVTSLLAGISLAWFVLAVGVDRYSNVPQTMPLLVRVMFMFLWSLPLLLALVPQVTLWSRRPTRRTRMYLAIRSALFFAAVLLPWITGYVVTTQCEEKFADSPSYTCH